MSKMNKANCDAIVRLRAYKQYSDHQRHRIYMEYCRYGDLSCLIKRYRGKRSAGAGVTSRYIQN